MLSKLLPAFAIFTALCLCSEGFSAPKSPADINSIINEFPNKKLDLQTLILIGSRSQNFKSVQSEFALSEAPRLEAEAIYHPTLSFSATQQVDETEKALPFEASTIHAENYEVKLSKLFMTGTAAELGFTHLNYRPDYTMPGAFNVPNYEASTATLKVSQPLWSNAFGYATRQTYKATHLAAQAQKAKSEHLANQWFLGIVEQLYKAWAAQQIAIANQEILSNRQKLLGITQVNRRRGTALSKDLLQLESAVTINQMDVEDAEDRLQAIWDTLVIVADLPAEWKNAETLRMPISLDDPFAEALAACESHSSSGAAISSQVQYLKFTREAAQHQLKAAKNLANPELNLFGEYGSNEMGDRFSDTAKESFELNHPKWLVGIELKVPFSFAAEKAKALRAYVAMTQAEAAAVSSVDDNEIVWQNSCRTLKLSQKRIAELEKAVAQLKKRETLERSDFRLGRASSFNYIQAGLDAINAEISLINEKVNSRLLAWKIIAATKDLTAKIKEFAAGIDSRITQ